MDIKKTLNDRKAKYGDFRGHATLSTELKRTMRRGASWAELPPYMEEALDMIQHKIARILNGDPTYEDSWVDVIGYAQLALDRLKQDITTQEIHRAFDEVTISVGDLGGTTVASSTIIDRDQW